ncbi:helix-turn-helix transcriptional regulator [Tepidanaerobacter syntrophicus]|uniref:helix-turn-helix transcriptional regulator n=1 Tax=Tepidanaerobacter syntrophicus TaxID=224999 RepID=UPI0023A88020|nr:helix-turn-helix domain-containing protein [Tepidanaerobacter syntrophicus]
MVKNKSGLSREFIIHPGETLKEVLEERGMSQKELALRTGVTEAHVSSLKQIPEVSQVGAYLLVHILS